MFFKPSKEGYLPLNDIFNMPLIKALLNDTLKHLDLTDLEWWKFLDGTESYGVSVTILNTKAKISKEQSVFMPAWIGYLCISVFKCFNTGDVYKSLEDYGSLQVMPSLFCEEELVSELIHGFELAIIHYEQALNKWMRANNYKGTFKLTLDGAYNLVLIYTWDTEQVNGNEII